MSLLIGTRNFANQTAAENQILSLGSVYRRFCRRINGVRTFEFDNSEVILQQSGIYHITVTAVASGAEAGDITLALYENGVPVPGARPATAGLRQAADGCQCDAGYLLEHV